MSNGHGRSLQRYSSCPVSCALPFRRVSLLSAPRPSFPGPSLFPSPSFFSPAYWLLPTAGLPLRRGRFPSRHGLARPFPRSCVGMGSLSPHRQPLAVPEPAIRPHIDVSADVQRRVTPEISLHLIALVDELTNLDHIVVGQLIAIDVQRHSRRLQNRSGGASPDPVDVR